MNIKHTTYRPTARSVRFCLSSIFVMLLALMPLHVVAQIQIGGNVYGGGNHGKVEGNTSVTVHAGDLNKVFGGARQADVGGSAFAHIDGEHASDYILINYVFGGNDIAGTVGNGFVPTELTGIRTAADKTAIESTEETNEAKTAKAEAYSKNDIDNTWNAFVRITSSNEKETEIEGTEEEKATAKRQAQIGKVYIGQLFGGGNGDYDYTADDFKNLTKPELAKTYLEIVGGSIVYAFGGGNNATVTDETVIYVDNPSEVVSSITDADGNELLNDERIKEMGYNPGYTYPTSDAFQIGSFFGGNNKAEMAIRPTWNLQRGKIRNVYSGGNQGDMTSDDGLLLIINPKEAYKDLLVIDNVFGGCRRADVRPKVVGSEEEVTQREFTVNGEEYKFPAGLRARTVVRGGDINNIYGGNDISGRVYGGNAIGLRCSIRGDLYGGGNGAYPYTDNEDLKNDPTYGDLYYDPATAATSVEALNAHRPNAEQVSIRLWGPSAENPTIIHGSVYVGGNCATISSIKTNPLMELKIGSNVIADNVFLANNGESMVEYHKQGKDDQGIYHYHEGVLRTYQSEVNGKKFNYYMDLTDAGQFAKYMDGVASSLMPSIVFDGEQDYDLDTYEEYSTFVGSLYCGGNVGSMTVPGKTTLNLNHHVIIYDKIVGGCNNANVAKTDYNAAYEGGLLGSAEERNAQGDGLYEDASGKVNDRLEINLSGLRIRPMRWNADKTKLVWNTYNTETDEGDFDPSKAPTGISTSVDEARRLTGGNIYGGCYNSGHVNGNVVINIDGTVVARENVFDHYKLDTETGEPKLYGNDHYDITERVSGVILDCQGMDVLGSALNIFGGGYGKDSEIWGSATINMNAGYAFQIFGGGEQGAIGKGERDEDGNLTYTYTYNSKFSTYINMKGNYSGVYRGHANDNDDMAEAEFIYGGGFEGLIAGDTHINLGNGRIFDSFGGSCNADILGHTETIVGYNNGFPWIRDYVYGGNDLGGEIQGSKNFKDDVRSEVASMVHNPSASENPSAPAPVLTANAYIEYQQGRVENIFGGSYGDYDYDSKDSPYYRYRDRLPFLKHAFVNFRPNDNNNIYNRTDTIFGAGQGHAGGLEKDKMQESSYVLIDIPTSVAGTFSGLEVFGAGAWGGVGMKDVLAPNAEGLTEAKLDAVSAIIDLARGTINAAYGGSYKEGFTRRTVVNVPAGSTIKAQRLFGGAFGESNANPCDVYEAHVNYNSADAQVGNYRDGIYGGNNNARRTLYSFVNINTPVWYDKSSGYLGTVFGGGRGDDTWSEYTEVHLNNGAQVYEVYGGGYGGKVINEDSFEKFVEELAKGKDGKSETEADKKDDIVVDTSMDEDLPNGPDNPLVNETPLVNENGLGKKKCNTNVYINKGASVSGYLYDGSISGGYAYGGGYGEEATVAGTTYIGLHGGTVVKDIYAGGTSGAVEDKYGLGKEKFIATANAFIEGGSVRNVYGGGWKGSVGHHEGGIDASTDGDIDGETYVVIGIREDQATLPDGYGFYKGVPTVQRNAYGGGEGGAVFGTSHLTLNNGYIGYVFNEAKGTYEEKVDDETWIDHIGANRLYDSGNVFGGGYIDNSSVDFTKVTMWGGMVRNSLCGGGEIAAIGRGAVSASGQANSVRSFKGLYKAGSTYVEMYNGKVLRNVFGGGKGYDNLGRVGTLYTDGYVFGQTKVYIHGGEIGTTEGVADNHGNVFGGGDIGYVYSRGYNLDKTKNEKVANPNGSTGSPNHWYYYDDAGNLTEDCKVVIAPYLQVKGNAGTVTINEHTYKPYEYVPTDDLNTLPKQKDSEGNWTGGWENLDDETKDADGKVIEERGIIIHNAVFGGGNVSSNSDRTYANATTVFGNTTATLYDVYHRDFITIGTEHIGGLYGGGNLSMVDGYRELNISNYGTDYYGLQTRISLDEYRNLSNRERAYFQLEYVCKNKYGVDVDGEHIDFGGKISEEKYLKLIAEDESQKSNWEPYGFCSIYAGRLLNTIQRADFCGVYGSRMVLQGAKDRVADVAEKVDYTLNRVGELSLNAQKSRIEDDLNNDTEKEHGNYFGIYSLVHYLGNLTSDVRMIDPYSYQEGEEVKVDPDQTYYSYKKEHAKKSDRNRGKSHNQVALASGVFLELTTENSTEEHKDYGYITGVVELDLINVKRDQVGGGFVYAKNEHHVSTYYPNKSNVILSEYNHQNSALNRAEARTYKRFYFKSGGEPTGDEANDYIVQEGEANGYALQEFQTSGNFIHPSKTKRIVDDCYPINNAYDPDKTPYAEAHYWYVKGEVYIYDQYLSAYTGSATAYSKAVNLPLTITAASHGQLQLINVKPNLYAYYANTDKTKKIGDKDENGKTIEKVMVNNESESYELNDVITWWDYNNLSASDKLYFVPETYVNSVTCTIDDNVYAPGEYVMDDKDFNTFKSETHTVKNIEGETVLMEDISKIFHSSNNIGHDTGYALTFRMNTPKVWDSYYTKIDDNTVKLTNEEYGKLSETDKHNYRTGPTYYTGTTATYGARDYQVGEIITKTTYDGNNTAGDEKATMEEAYVAKEEVTYTYNGVKKTLYAGTAIPESEYISIVSAQASFARAWVCTSTIKLADDNYLLYTELKTEEELEALKVAYPSLADDITNATTPAYICSKEGKFGGQKYTANTNYSAINTLCTLSEEERNKFNFNYDALDLLIDPDYLAEKTTKEAYREPYSNQEKVDYNAVFQGTTEVTSITLIGGGTVDKNSEPLSNADFETKVRNDQRHYARVDLAKSGTVYIATTNFIYAGVPYGKGQVIEEESVATANAANVKKIEDFPSGTNYYCYEEFTDKDNNTIAEGTIISKGEYDGLTNDQKYFIIQGQEPTETATLYVSRESNIEDLSKEKIITVVYQYTYYEDEDDGSVKLTNELHVINIHLELESGVPQIGQLNPPGVVLPGTAIGLKAPEVTPGLYEILTNGWEIFTNHDDAEHHRNGVPFTNNKDQVYWYQNQKNWVAFYSKTYLGKTYSNPVPLSVANYHNLADVMADKKHHMYVDYDPEKLERDCKIYINDGTKGIDDLKDFIDLSYRHGPDEHEPLASYVTGGDNLEFILRTNIDHTDKDGNPLPWTPIANDTGECFSGNFHGDGYYISGLTSSLFNHLCGNVYNLGVMGSFTGAGIAEEGKEGYVENCWIRTTSPDAKTSKPVFGNPTRGSGVQIVNCYYQEEDDASNKYANHSGSYGTPTRMDARAFYNGTVAYDLNGFYLNKRYYDKKGITGDKKEYQYLLPAADGTLPDDMTTGYYPTSYEAKHGSLLYVEDRFADGDFRYAGGSIPEGIDIHLRTTEEEVTTDDGKTETKVINHFAPIWPDDYIYFGQMLTYGYNTLRPHEEVPSHLAKNNGRLYVSEQSNRVYRAPAYYRSKDMDVAHFNLDCNLVAKSKPLNDYDTNLHDAYPNMTAIDFAGHNDASYKQGFNGAGNWFYQPLLDDDGLLSIVNRDETPNLLVYAPSAEQNSKTYTVLNNYFVEPGYTDYAAYGSYRANGSNGTNGAYKCVLTAPTQTIYGHLVQSTLKATNDHLLVDKQDFNCPIGYMFDSSHLMWYQRKPDNYVDLTKGWESISLPFTAELVTTNDKGEITHFYGGSATSKNDTETKIGHEYWLREYCDISDVDAAKKAEAVFNYPESAGERKEVSNTFLWDYYYQGSHTQQDANGDTYEANEPNGTDGAYQYYYRAARTLENYPRLTAATPYIIGFPGTTYYEFDLSGGFDASTTGTTKPDKLGAQTISFVSEPGIRVNVSDDEVHDVTFNRYSFRSSYLNETLELGDDAYYTLAADGSKYSKVPTSDDTKPTVVAFRPYFVATPSSARTADYIVFNNTLSSFGEVEADPSKEEVPDGQITFRAQRGKIVTHSSLHNETTVSIFTTSGLLVTSFNIKPDETVETPINFTGIYIARAVNGRYTQKLSVK